MKEGEIKIFTDGASRGNPGPGGWGAIIAGDGKVEEIGGREEHTTNNRMELTAVIKVLEFISSLHGTSYKLHVFTDSSYVKRGVTEWVPVWEETGWKTKTKKAVLNQDLWQRFKEVSEDTEIEWILLPGHSGIAANERCDEIATAFADKKKIELYSGPEARYEIDLSNIEVSKKKKAESRNSGKAYSYVSMVDGKIQTHKTWAECEARVSGVSGARFKKAGSLEEEREIINSWTSER